MAAVRPDRLMRRAVLAAPMLALAALVALAVPLALHVSGQHDRDSERSAVLNAARAEVGNLMNISSSTAGRDLDRVIALATGNLRHQFEIQRAHVQALAQAKSALTGTVVTAGVLWVDTDKSAARTVVAATGTDSSGGSAATLRHYRWVLTLHKVGARWLVADAALEGVPS